MTTLDDAWQWYQDAHRALSLIHRLGEKHWYELPWGDDAFPLVKDDVFRMLDPTDIVRPAEHALQNLNDLAIVVLFSVFEAVVRERLVQQIEPESAKLQHQSLITAAQELLETIRFGSFFRVLAPFRKLEPNLTEEVDQVRDYRNWVAHGHRGTFKNAVTPEVAFDRLARFLDKFVPATISEQDWLTMLRETGD